MVWAARNQIVYGGKRSAMGDIARRVRLLSWEHREAWSKKFLSSRVNIWQPPPSTKIKINVDITIRDCFAVTIAIARDHEG